MPIRSALSLPGSRRARRATIAALLAMFVAAGVFLATPSEQAAFRVSMATAYSALAFLGLSLAIGALNVLRGRPNPVSTHLRRDVGIVAALAAWAHVVAGFQVHFGGRILSYLMNPADGTWRRDPFGLANYTGLGAILVLTGLLVLSNDLSLRRLGTARWKSLQRWNYAAFGLVVVHGALYQVIEKRAAPYVAAFLICVALVAGLQWSGFRIRRSRTAQLR